MKVLLRANRVLVLAQLLLLLLASAFAALLSLLFDGVSWRLLVIPAGVLLGAAVNWLTVRCLHEFDARVAVAIAVLSMPVYAATVLLWIMGATLPRG